MSPQECPRTGRVRAALMVLLAVVAFAAACSDPEQTKAEHVSRGEAFLQEKKWQEAIIEFRNALQIDENLAAAYWGLSQAFEQLGRSTEAFEALVSTVKLDPTHVAARLKLGNAYLAAYGGSKKQEFLLEAERMANEILARDDRHIDGHILMANVIYLKGGANGGDEALKRINYAISLDPQRVESHLSLARFHLQDNNPTEAEVVFRKAASINPNSSLVHVEYGKFLIQTGRKEQAEESLRRAVDVDPQNRDVRWVLASYYYKTLGRLDKAEEAYKAWAQMDWDKPEGRARLADYYAMIGRYEEAANLYREAVQAFPDFSRGRYRLGEINLQRGDIEGAKAQADELLKANQRDSDALFLRARMNLASGRTRDAIADLKTVLEQEPRSQLGLFFMSDALYRDGQFEQARTRAGELERFYPDFLPAKLLQVQINLDSGNADASRRLATELLDRLDKTAEAPGSQQTPQLLAEVRNNALVLRAKSNLALKALPAARSDAEAARSQSPNSTAPHVTLADVAFAEGKREEAAQHLERALAIDRTNFHALNGLIHLAAFERRLDAARARVEQLAGEQPGNAALHFLLAQSYRLGNDAQPADPQRAEAALRRALEADPDYVPAYSALAEIYFALQQPDRAIAEYQKIIERRQDDVVAYRNIGMIESGRKNLDAAEQYYRRALSVRPDDPIAANNLAMLYADHGRGNGDEAMRLAQEVLSRNPDNPGFADTLGWVYYRKGLHAAAVEQLQKAVRGASNAGADNSLYRYHLGMALAGKGDKAAARRELQKALQLAEAENQRPVKPPTTLPADEARRVLESL